MKTLLAFIFTLSSFAALANPQTKLCRAEALKAASEAYELYHQMTGGQVMIRLFSSRSTGDTITHYVQVRENGSSSMLTVELDKSSCQVVRFE